MKERFGNVLSIIIEWITNTYKEKEMKHWTKRFFVIGFAALITIALAGCPYGTNVSTWYLKLSINPFANAKSITATTFSVVRLSIDVMDPEGAVIETVDWGDGDGPQDFVIPVTSQGDYELIVTHIGEQNGDVVEVVEKAGL